MAILVWIFLFFVLVGCVSLFWLLFSQPLFQSLWKGKLANRRIRLIAASLSTVLLVGLVTSTLLLRPGSAPPDPASAPIAMPRDNWQLVIDRFGLPEIPLLPSASASISISGLQDRYCNTRPEACQSLLGLAADVVLAIENAGFPEIAVFFGYDGHYDESPKVIIATPVERIDASGNPAAIDRFNDARPQALRGYDWREFLRVMFNGREGRLRFFVVEIGDDEIVPFSDGRRSYYELAEQIETGAVRLPALLHRFPVHRATHVTFYVYHYNAIRGEEPQPIEGERPARDELSLAGIHLPDF